MESYGGRAYSMRNYMYIRMVFGIHSSQAPEASNGVECSKLAPDSFWGGTRLPLNSCVLGFCCPHRNKICHTNKPGTLDRVSFKDFKLIKY